MGRCGVLRQHDGSHRFFFFFFFCRGLCEASAAGVGGRWSELPAVAAGRHGVMPEQVTAFQWVRKCCPHVPHSLLQKLFRVRQIRALFPASQSNEITESRFRRVHKEDHIGEGTVLYIPKSVYSRNVEAQQDSKEEKIRRRVYEPTLQDSEEIRNLVIHMDEHVIAINKPPGLAVQGGVGIHRSLDMLLGPALSFKYEDSPKLVHRLDKHASGIMVLGRTSESTALLHSLFRAKTASAVSEHKESLLSVKGIERKYLALVIGTLTQRMGRITAPLKKVALDGGKFNAVLLADDVNSEDSIEAVTDYEVVGPSVLGCTWLHLHPLTGRKHQLRVHCAQALGTPILGDYKYGRQVHENWRLMSSRSTFMSKFRGLGTSQNYNSVKHDLKMTVEGSIASEKPLLHLHSHMLTIPQIKDLSVLGPSSGSSNTARKAFVKRLRLIAPLPEHMNASWNLFPPSSKASRDPDM